MTLTAKQVRNIRIANRIAQKDFAELIGVPTGTWSNVELGNQPFYANVQAKAVNTLKELGCDFSILNTNTEYPKYARVQKDGSLTKAYTNETIVTLPVLEKTAIDMVESPPHYAMRKYEVIDVMEDTMTEEQFIGYLVGCVIKYMTRWDKKTNPEEDLKKAHWYLNRLIVTVERNKPTPQGE